MVAERKPLEGQVALVAGATRGAGRGIARMLGAAGATVYCTGRSGGGHGATPGRAETLEETAALVDQEGGIGRAIRVDHTIEAEVANLMERIRTEAGRLDILVNDIWGGDALIDWSKKFWEIDIAAFRTLIDRAVVSHLLTSRYGAPLMIEKGRGLIVEVTDGHTDGYRGQIIYDLVKSSNVRLGYAMAWDLAETPITALTLTPGFLRSEAVLDHFGVRETNWRDAIAKDSFFAESETPCFVGRAVAALAADPNVRAKAGNTYLAADLATEYGFTDLDGSVPRFQELFDRTIDQILARGAGIALEGEDRFFVWARYCQIHRQPQHRERAMLLAGRLGIANAGAGLQPQ